MSSARNPWPCGHDARKSQPQVTRRRRVAHQPVWVPAELPIDAEGNTRPGFECAHEMENGGGRCGGNVFRIEDAIGDHACIVEEEA